MSYGANSILALSLHLPATGRLVEGTVAKPYLAIDLDCEMVSELLLGLSQVPAVAAEAFTASPMEATMIEPVLRLSRLADIPEDAAQLAPLLIQEILYRAIKGPIGHSCTNLRVKTVAPRR